MQYRLLYICLFAIGPVYLQGWAQPHAYRIPGYSVTHYTDENGLPQNSIKNICSDFDGYIWLATEAGLVRYDGRRFRLYTKEEVGTSSSRVSIMERQPFNNQLYAIMEDGSQALLKTNTKNQVFYPINPYFNDNNLSRLRGKPASSYVYHRIALFPEFENKEAIIHINRDTFYIASPSHVIYRTHNRILWETDAIKKDGYFFYWQGHKLYQYNHEGIFDEITPQGVKPALKVPGFKKLIWSRGNNQTYIATQNNELFLLETDPAGRLVMVPFMTGLPPDFEIEKVVHLQKEIVFIGSLQQGLLVCKKQHFKTLGADLPRHQSIHYGILPSQNDIITAKKNRISPDGKITPLIRDDYESFNTTLTRLGNDSLLFAQANDVLVYSQKQNRLLATVPIGSQITSLYTDRAQQVWIATIDSGIFRMDSALYPVKQFRFTQPHYVNVIHQISENHLLLGTSRGLYSYHTHSHRLVGYHETKRFNIRHITTSRSGYLYFSTYGDGIFMLGKEGLIQLPTDRAGYLQMAHCVLQDQKGRLWISTNKGLFSVPEIEIIRYAHREISRIQYHYLDKESGFRTNEFNGGCQPCGIKLKSGRMAFPSMNGIVVFHPDSVYFLNPAKKPDVDRVSVDDVFLKEISDTVSVPRNFRQLEIYLSTPFFGTAQNLFIEYTLDSTQSNSWSPVHSDRRVSFTSLPSGYSHLSFRQKKMAGLGAYSSYTLVLYKPKAIWEFPLFWAMGVIATMALVAVAIRMRTRTLKQRNRNLAEAVEKARNELLVTIDSLTDTTHQLEQKTRFQQWLTSSIVHDLRGPLRFINFYGGDIKKEDEEVSPAQNKFLKSVYFSALKIYNYSDNLVQLLRIEQASDFPPEKTDFIELIEDKFEQFREQAKWNGITLQLDPDSDPFLYINQAALSIILQNLLDNAIKNFKNGNVSLSLKNSDSQSTIQIQDEGPGIPPDLLWKINHHAYDEMSRDNASGLGLWLVKSLMAQTGGNIRFENLPEKGLLVTLTWEIPMD